jgi:hypothetical protein
MYTTIVYNHDQLAGNKHNYDSVWLFKNGQFEVGCVYHKEAHTISIRGFNHRQEPILLARFRMSGEDQEGLLQV